MNRRTFLKSIAAACGAAVVCPSELLRGESKQQANRVYALNFPSSGVNNVELCKRIRAMQFAYHEIPIHYQENLPE